MGAVSAYRLCHAGEDTRRLPGRRWGCWQRDQNAGALKSMEKIPLLDLRKQYGTLREEIRAALDEVLESQQFILGPKGALLEQEVAAY